jgi:tetratricopeptide (TPR) repeat protein
LSKGRIAMISRLALILVFCLFLLIPSIAVAQEGYYHMGKEQLEFRFAVKRMDKTEDERGWEDLTDLENKHFLVSREAVLDAEDIDGVFVDKPFDDVTYSITIYFKKKAWNKVHNITSRNIKRRLAIVKDGKLIMAPVLREALDGQADIVGNIDQTTVEWFLKGFIRAKEPPEEKARREEEAEKSKEELMKKVREHPDDIDSQMGLVNIYMFRKPRDYARAAVLLENFIKIAPKRTDGLSLLATCYEHLGEYEKAVEILGKLQTVKPSEELTTRVQLADVYRKWRHYDSAIKELSKSLKILDSSNRPGKELMIETTRNEMKGLQLAAATPDGAVCAEYAGTDDKIIDACTSAIKSKSLTSGNLALAYYYRANAWFGKKDYDKAIVDYTKAVSLDPKNDAAYYGLGISWSKKGDYDKAITDYSRAISVNSRNEQAYSGRGAACYRKGDYNKAIADYTQALSIDPMDDEVYVGRGLAWARKGDYDKAIADYTNAISLNPADIYGYYNRGNAWYRRGDYDKAIADYTEVINRRPTMAYAYYVRAISWYRKGDDDKALADYSNAIRFNPKSAEAYGGRGNIWQVKGDYDKAIADDTKAIGLNPKDAWPYRGRGIARFDSGEFLHAVSDLSKAQLLKPDTYIAIWLYLAQVRGRVDGKTELGLTAKNMDKKKWPAAVVELYLGKADPATVISQAADPDPKKDRGHICEADFFLGEWHLLRNEKQVARKLLTKARNECPRHYYQYTGALSELKRMQ